MTGPGVRISGVEQTEGFIIDWKNGSVGEPPSRLARYEVRFFEGCRPGETGPYCGDTILAYIVRSN